MLNRLKVVGKGFTIVELLIVVVVIAILATITIVAYNGIQSRALESSIISGLTSVGQKVEAHNIQHSSYPSGLELIGVADTETVHYQYTREANGFCLSATSPRSNALAFHVSNTDMNPVEGVCEGHLSPEDMEEEVEFVVAPREKTFNGNGSLGLSVHVPEAWNKIVINWNSQPGAQRYELQSRTSSTADWRFHRINNGNINIAYSDPCPADSASCTGRIPSSTTSLEWLIWSQLLPVSAGGNFEYRVRYLDESSNYSNWDTVTVSNPIQSSSNMPRKVNNFSVTPASNWANITLSWEQVPDIAITQSDVKYELQTRTSSTADWRHHRTVGGSRYVAYTDLCQPSSPTCSGMIPYTTTSLTWNASDVLPASAGATYEYRIRIKVVGSQTYHSDWVTTKVANPVQSNDDLPSIVTGFSVAPAANWSNITLSWNQVPNFAANMNHVKYELQVKPSPTDDWRFHRYDYGSQYYAYSYPCTEGSTNCSRHIPYSTSSLTWNNSAAMPPAAGGTYQYRIRVWIAGLDTYHSDWVTVNLTR